MADDKFISQITPLGSATTYKIKDSSAITNITRSGTTFTATRHDGTTFTFTQQDNNTKNTAGSTDTANKIFLIGATEQSANPQTYSHDTAYVGTDGCLYSGGKKVLTDHQSLNGYATETYVNNAFAANDAMIFKGIVAGSETSPGGFTVAANRGDTYKVSTAGYVNGVKVEVGDTFICITDNTAAATSSNYSTIQANWVVVQTNIDGAVIGPVSATDNAVVRFDGTGRVVQDSLAILSDTGSLTLPHHLILQKSDSIAWQQNGSDNEPQIRMIGANNKIFKFKLTGKGQNLDLGWDWAAGEGAGAAFRSSTFSNGEFVIYARKNTDAEYILKGTTAGVLTWNNRRVITGTSVGNSTTPVYIDSNGYPQALSYTISKSVPSNAIFTDTTYENKAAVSGGTEVSLVTTGEKYTWNNKGTVTTVSTGIGLTGGDITTIGTIKAKLKSETALTLESAATTTGTTDRVYPVVTDKSGFLAVDVPWQNTSYTFANGTNSFTVTPAGGSTQTITVTPSIAWNGITQSGANSLDEGTSDFTDNTELFSSYASNNGFADSAATGKVYRRDAIHMYNYIKTKLAVTNNTINLSRNTETTIATIGGTAIKIKLPASDNTDRYVNSASFADDTANTAASPVKMTLTRAGSDANSVTANIPKVSASSAGVAPKGAAVSSQNQNTKFLREDGTWAKPSYTTNTNTDTLVKQTVKTDNVEYKILSTISASPTSGNAAEAAYGADFTINPSAKTITSPNFKVTSNATITYNTATGCLEIIV